MSRIANPSAPVDAPVAPSAGSITDPFRRENLAPSSHPAFRPNRDGGQSAGGQVNTFRNPDRFAGKTSDR
jgi:hypothetical protein